MYVSSERAILAFQSGFVSKAVGSKIGAKNTNRSLAFFREVTVLHFRGKLRSHRMIMGLTLRWIAEAIQGRIRKGDPEAEYVGISTDTRSLKKGEVFWALKGERFDGHDFLGDAVHKGAQGVVIEERRSVSGGKEGKNSGTKRR